MPVQRESFKGVSHINQTLLMNKLEINLKSWFDWAFLRIGAWTDIDIPSVHGYGGDLSVLRLVDDPSYITGTVWEAARKDWAWEANVDYVDVDNNNQNPISPAVIKVNGTTTTPSYINYELGRVVFSSPVSSSALVTANYSYRNIQVYRANDVPWLKELQYKSFNNEDIQFDQTDNGFWSIGSQHRVQMPCIIIESIPRCKSRGFQMGDGSAWVEQDVICTILAENNNDRNQLVDTLRGQFDATIWLFDNDLVAINNDNALDYRGAIVNSSKHYRFLVSENGGYRWESCRFSNTSVSEMNVFNSRLFSGVVRMTCEVVLDD